MGKSTYTIKSYILMMLQFTLMQFWCSAFTVKKNVSRCFSGFQQILIEFSFTVRPFCPFKRPKPSKLW